jgi:hypothetical protein
MRARRRSGPDPAVGGQQDLPCRSSRGGGGEGIGPGRPGKLTAGGGGGVTPSEWEGWEAGARLDSHIFANEGLST